MSAHVSISRARQSGISAATSGKRRHESSLSANVSRIRTQSSEDTYARNEDTCARDPVAEPRDSLEAPSMRLACRDDEVAGATNPETCLRERFGWARESDASRAVGVAGAGDGVSVDDDQESERVPQLVWSPGLQLNDSLDLIGPS
jgi:hypothetical protein